MREYKYVAYMASMLYVLFFIPILYEKKEKCNDL